MCGAVCHQRYKNYHSTHRDIYAKIENIYAGLWQHFALYNQCHYQFTIRHINTNV